MPLGKDEIALLELWYDDPDQFDRDIWPNAVDAPEPWQTQASGLVAKYDRVAIRSGHGVGKTAWLARRILWWLSTRAPAKVGCTSPSSSQLFDALWSEIAKWHGRMPPGIRDRLEWKTERVELKDNPNVCFAVAKTARRETPEALAGLHSENMLFLIDEAAGVDDIIFETARGAMSTLGAKTVMTGNPTRLSGYFYDAFHKNRAHWKTMKVACTESSRTNHKEIEQWKEEYGEDSNFFRVRALGEFPTAEDDVIIPLYMVEAAVVRDVVQIDSEEIWGLDIARSGSDKCALAKRRGNVMPEKVKTWRTDDLMVSVGKVKMEYDDVLKKPELICVDSNGLGAGVADRLSEMGLPVMCINVSESHSSNDRYLRVRDEMWERARAWFFQRDCKIAKDETFVGQISLVKWRPTSNGKMKVVTKDEMKLPPPRGIGKSPDESEAFVFTFMTGQGIVRKPKPIKYPSYGYA
jgi:phage terminase large subunit